MSGRGDRARMPVLIAAAFGGAFLVLLVGLALGAAWRDARREFGVGFARIESGLRERAQSAQRVLPQLAQLQAVAARSALRATPPLDCSLLLGDLRPARYLSLWRIAAGHPVAQWQCGEPQSLPTRWPEAAIPAPGDDLPFALPGMAPPPDGFLLARRLSGGELLLALIETRGLLPSDAAFPGIGLALLLEAEGGIGRRTLFAPSAPPDAGVLSGFLLEDEAQLAFPGYSLRLHAARTLAWRELDYRLPAAAAVLGTGVLLLVVALARSREDRLRELAERAQVIEEQVTLQTRELASARDAAFAAARAKAEFLARMSHEIRTPLNAILGTAEVLHETPLSEEQRQWLETSQRAGEGLLSVINDVLDLSRLESGQVPIEQVELDPAALLREVADLHRIGATRKGLHFDLDLSGPLPARLRSDPARLRQVLHNLLGNAIKFTAQGQVGLRAWCEQEGAGQARLCFEVHDTGIGIPPAQREQVFEQFVQADTSTTRRYGGTGLGLTISRELMVRMGGGLSVVDGKAEGACLRGELPFALEDMTSASVPSPAASPQAGARDSGQAAASDSRTLLLVEDNADNRLLARAFLKGTAWEISEAHDGAAAVQACARHRFDLVLMDIEMPVMDGHEATRLIRAAEAESGRAPMTIVALTAHALAEERAAILAAGCDDCLTKPLAKATLLACLEALGPGATASGQG